MSTEYIVSLTALIASVAAVMAAITQLVQAIRAMHTQINGRMDELVAANRAAGVAQGVAQEQAAPTRPAA